MNKLQYLNKFVLFSKREEPEKVYANKSQILNLFLRDKQALA